MLDWLLVSLDPSRPHEITDAQAWHGRLMVLAWGICVPAGILIARFFKVTPKQDWPRELDNRFWWRSHLLLQGAAGIAMIFGINLIIADGISWTPEGGHGWFGRILVLAVAFQYLSGALRGSKGGPTDPGPDGSLTGDHYAMTRRRRLFEVFHKSVGYVLLFMSAWIILQGLWIVNAPRWMLICLLLLWGTMLGFAAVLSTRNRVSTYQAIWGPSPELPGNSGHQTNEH